MRKFVLSMSPDTFIWFNRNEGIAYNTQNYKSFKFELNDYIKYLCEELNKPSNLYTLIIDETHIKDKSVEKWIDGLTKINSARIESFTKDYKVSLKPMVKIQNDSSRIINNKDWIETTQCITEISFHLTGVNLSHKEKLYHKQFLYPIESDELLKFEDIKYFIELFPPQRELTFNFLGDLNLYPQINQLVKFISCRKGAKVWYIRLDDINEYLINSSIIKNFDIHIICLSDNDSIEKINRLSHKMPKAKFVFLISSEKEYHNLERIKNVNNCAVFPIYTGKNLHFFDKHVFLTQDDLQKIKIEKRHIFMNQSLNATFWGKLEILPNGTIWTNHNFPSIGHVRDSISLIISNLFENNSAWFYIRDQYPCKQCIYQWICMPPSNYELIINKPNLCKLNP